MRIASVETPLKVSIPHSNAASAIIEGVPVVADVSSIHDPVDTVTMYVGPQISSGLADKLITLRPRRVIFNPGAENEELAAKLRAAGIACEDACTLVLLSTGAF